MESVFESSMLESRASKPASGARFLVLLLAVAACLALPGAVFADEGEDDDRVEGVRTALEKWVETRRLLSQEKRDWALGREMLDNRIDLVRREIESLRARIKDAEESIAEADKKRTDLVDRNEKLKQASAALVETVEALESRTVELLHRLPDPIRERIKPLSQRIPEESKETKLSLSERFMNIVGILNSVNKFNRDITVTSEVRTLKDGTKAEVTALYVGIGQGYYASADGKSAGVGTATQDGWVWAPADDAAPRITEAIKILKNEEVAGFVRLPIRIQGPVRNPDAKPAETPAEK